MNKELLEKWIEENTCVPVSRPMIPVDAVRALLAGKVLCDVEPVYVRYVDDADFGCWAETEDGQAVSVPEEMDGRYVVMGPLYKPVDTGAIK